MTVAMDDRKSRQEPAIVLLATYDGARFLERQIDSITAQTRPVQILARDDGSSDGSLEIVRRYKGHVTVLPPDGVRRGASGAFAALLAAAPPAELVLFSDQDDIWHHDKVARAASALATIPDGVPGLYCSALELVDAEERVIGRSPLWPRPPSLANALVENIASGCTIALNRAAAQLLAAHPPPQQAIMHDWWAYLAVVATGTVIYDPVPSISYRIHAGNEVGLPTSRIGWLLDKIRRKLRQDSLAMLVEQAIAFEEAFAAHLDDHQRAMIARLVATRTPRGRLAFLGEREIHRQFSADHAALLALVLTGKTRRSRPSPRPVQPD